MSGPDRLGAPEGDAGELVRRLEEHYRAYAGGTDRPEEKKGFARLFRHWVSYNAQSIEPVHQGFLDGASALAEELAAALEPLAAARPEESRALAARAVGLMLEPKPQGVKSDREWYLTAAEYTCAPLLPFLSREELGRQKDAMLARTPRRMMYPKQLELLERAEALLGDKAGRAAARAK